MCGCWEGSGASAASAGFSRSLLFSYSPFTVYSISLYLSTYLYPSFILSSLRLALTVGLWYLQIQIPNFSGAITQPLSFSGPPFFVSLSLSLSLSFYYSLSLVSSLVSSLSFSLSRSFFFSVALCQGPSATCATGRPLPVNPAGCPTPTYMAAAQLYPSRAPLTRSTHRDPPPAPLPCRHRVSHGDRTKFIPPNDFITLLRTFNSKLLLRPGHQRN